VIVGSVIKLRLRGSSSDDDSLGGRKYVRRGGVFPLGFLAS
jgi:hypothetical protein